MSEVQHEENQLNGSAHGGVDGFLKRTLNLFSESFRGWNDNARLLFGCTQVHDSGVKSREAEVLAT